MPARSKCCMKGMIFFGPDTVSNLNKSNQNSRKGLKEMRTKRLLGVLLCIVMLIGICPLASLAAETQNGVQTFSDMPDNWSTAALQNAVANGLLEGAEGKILPNDNLTRAQMAAVIVRSFGTSVKGDISAFSDVKASNWFAGDVAKAYQMGVIEGSDGKMNPNSAITRQEVFVIIARALKLQPSETINKTFTDENKISAWARGEVYALVNAGYINGENGKLNPRDLITRAQFAQVLDNIIKQYINEAGEVTAVSAGNVMVNVPSVTLKDLIINGDLIIGDGVGDGEVTLDNVTVTGRMVVRGGGENSIIVKGSSSVANVIVARTDGAVSVKVEGAADIEVIYIDDGSDDVNIVGTVGDIELKADGIVLTATSANITSLGISGVNSKVVVAAGSRIATVNVLAGAANAKLEVAGTVATVTTKASGTEVTGAGTVTKVEAQEGATGASIQTPKTQIIVSANVTGVTGGGGTNIEGGSTTTNNQTGTGVDTTTTTKTGGSGGGSSSVLVTGISVADASVQVGSTYQMSATISPLNATNQTVSWSVANGTGAASISSSGLLSATSVGTVTVTATATDGSGISGSATVTVTAVPDADLTDLVLSGTVNDFTFASNTYQYSGVYVPHDQSSITVTPTLDGATITVNGTAVTSGTASAAINLVAAEEQTITVAVAKAGHTSKTYTISITRIPVWTQGVTIGDITLEPSSTITYGPESGTYTIDGDLTIQGSVDGTVTLQNIRVTGDLTINTPNATISVLASVVIEGNTNLLAVADHSFWSDAFHYLGIGIQGGGSINLGGSASNAPVIILTNQPVILGGSVGFVQVQQPGAQLTLGGTVGSLLVQQNGVNITNGGSGSVGGLIITSGLGDPTLTGWGAAPPPITVAADNLTGLTISNGTLPPAFSGSTYRYTATVGNAVSSITVTPAAAAGATAVVKAGGNEQAGGVVPLAVGENTITIEVSQAERTTITYTLLVKRQAAPPVAPTIVPATGAVAFGTTLTLTSADADYIFYTTDGSDPLAGVSGTTKVYNSSAKPVINSAMTVKAIAVKAGSPNSAIASASYTQAASADLTGIALSGNPSSFTFSGSTYSYNGLTVGNNIASITVTPTGAGAIKVDGVTVTSGSASAALALTAGIERTITVTAEESGKTVKTYTIKVTRLLNGDATVATTGSKYTVNNSLNTIAANDTSIYNTTTVGTFLGNLTKNEYADWKVLPSTASITNANDFNAASARINTATLAIGDLLAVMAQNGTIKVYAITVIEDTTTADNADIAAAKGSIEAASYTATQAEAGTSGAAATKAQALVDALSLHGTTAVVVPGTFTAAIAGTVGDQDGTNGSFAFTVNVSKGGGTAVTTAQKSMTITATPYDATQDNIEITGYNALADVNAGTAGSATFSSAAEVLVYLSNNRATATITGTAVTVPLTVWTNTDSYNPSAAGSYTFTAQIGTLPDGYVDAVDTISSVTVEVIVADAFSANLTSLTENLTASFAPAFADGTYSYSIAATSVEDAIQLTATLEGATISYTSLSESNTVVTSGYAKTVPLQVGLNTITIKVEKSGLQTATYTISVTRAAPFVAGSGTLGTYTDFTPEANTFSGFFVEQTERWPDLSGGMYTALSLSFPAPATINATGYTLQYSTDGGSTWNGFKYDGANNLTTESATQDNFSLELYGTYKFRLLVSGGPMNGYVSNVVDVTTATTPTSGVDTYFSSWSLDESVYISGTMIPWVGRGLESSFTVKTFAGIVISNALSYQWYRVNPVTFEMTPINGATGLNYTTTAADIGYDLMIRATADGVNANGFTQVMSVAGVVEPNRAYLSNVTASGFTLNLAKPAELVADDLTLEDIDGDPIAFSLTKVNNYTYNITANIAAVDYSFWMENNSYFWSLASDMMMGDMMEGISCNLTAVIPSTDATLASATIKGVQAASIGIPGSDINFIAEAGSATINSTQAADDTLLTYFNTTYPGAYVKAVKYAQGTSDFSGFAGASAYSNTDDIANGDFFIVRVTAEDQQAIKYYKIAVTLDNTVSALTDADVTITHGSIIFGYTFEAGSDSVTYAGALAAPYYLNKNTSTVTLTDGTNTAFAYLADLGISDSGTVTYEDVTQIQSVFEGLDFIPSQILLHLTGATEINAGANSWTKDITVNLDQAEINLLKPDSTPPTVTAAVQTVTNEVGQSVTASSSEAGTILIILDGEAHATQADLQAALTAYKASAKEAATPDTNVSISTTGLTGGTYHAYAVDAYGNISEAGTNAITVTQVITPGGGADKTTLSAALLSAGTNASSVATSVDGTDVVSTMQWVTSGVLTAYQGAISSAQAVADNGSATQQQVDGAVSALASATSTFNAAKQYGTALSITSVTLRNATDGVTAPLGEDLAANVGDVITITEVVMSDGQPAAGRVEYFAVVRATAESNIGIGDIIIPSTSNSFTIPANYSYTDLEATPPTIAYASVVGKYIDFGARIIGAPNSGVAATAGAIVAAGSDSSAATVTPSDTTPTQDVSFLLDITSAKGVNGTNLSGSVNVVVVSSDTTEGTAGTLYNAAANFTDGSAAITITLENAGAQILTVQINGVTAYQTVNVTVGGID